ncbi:hypothetical protein J6590_089766 [Homalodisca vitripennis]|nr:hypothetical protein J6590_089766 [Homalodisca vitripennis]
MLFFICKEVTVCEKTYLIYIAFGVLLQTQTSFTGTTHDQRRYHVIESSGSDVLHSAEVRLRHQHRKSDFLMKNLRSLLEEGREFPGEKPQWPVKREAVMEGDLILGGLMMVHERSDTVTCGPVMPQGGIQALETMLYTLDIVNSQGMLPFTLGAHILDDCDKDTYGLEMAVDFIKVNAHYVSQAILPHFADNFVVINDMNVE